jgi:hypothetical protein
MKTPITDAVYPPDIIDREYAAKGDTYGWGTLTKMRDTARRLELDRAALMDALCEIHILSHDYSGEGSIALKAIEAARANFPER